MKCPKCEKGWMQPKYCRGKIECPHCDGEGNIQHGDVWMCLMPDGETRMPLSLRQEDKRFVWREYDAYYGTDIVQPLFKLGMV